MENNARILIVDDHPLFRQGLRMAIESKPPSKVVSEAGSGSDAVKLAGELKPDVIVLDMDMPGMNGLEAARAILSELPAARIVFLTLHKDEGIFDEAMSIGAMGYMLKENAITDILSCIEAVMNGRRFVSPLLTDALLERTARADAFHREQPRLASLTASERRILRLIAGNKTSKEIAAELNISPRTVENHRANICIKLNLRGVHSLVKFAFDNRLRL
jgi:DNA-binding NarL/FixJ family response regulator